MKKVKNVSEYLNNEDGSRKMEVVKYPGIKYMVDVRNRKVYVKSRVNVKNKNLRPYDGEVKDGKAIGELKSVLTVKSEDSGKDKYIAELQAKIAKMEAEANSKKEKEAESKQMTKEEAEANNKEGKHLEVKISDGVKAEAKTNKEDK